MSDTDSNTSYPSVEEPYDPVFGLHEKFSTQKFPSVKIYWEHLQHTENLDMFEIFDKVDHHGYIRIVNYIRGNALKIHTTKEMLSIYNEKLKNDDDYLQPVKKDDPYIINAGDLYDDESQDELPPLKESKPVAKVKSKQSYSSTDVMAEGFTKERDAGYFEGYGYLDIHCEMISDFARTDAYKKGIQTAYPLKDKVVLDVGAGTGILSMFAAEGGAQKVFALEPANVASDAQEIICENGFQKTIKIIRKTSEAITKDDLEGNVPDIIVSEWMGYFLHFEGMLQSVISAREKFNNVPKMLPSTCTLRLSLLVKPRFWNYLYGSWQDKTKNRYGFKFSPLARYQIDDAHTEVIPGDEIYGAEQIHFLDLDKCSADEIDFESNYVFENLPEDIVVYGVVGHFDVGFNDKVILDTSPKATPTHWKQTVFPFKEPFKNLPGNQLKGWIQCQRQSTKRDLEVILQFPDMDNWTKRFLLD